VPLDHGLQLAKVLAALLGGWLPARALMLLALAAYASYVINAAQFLIKFRAARLAAPPRAAPLAAGALE